MAPIGLNLFCVCLEFLQEFEFFFEHFSCTANMIFSFTICLLPLAFQLNQKCPSIIRGEHIWSLLIIKSGRLICIMPSQWLSLQV